MAMAFVGNGQVNSGTAIPYQRIIEPSQLGLFLNLEQAELLRIRRYHEHWRFYTGQHWSFTREGGEPLVTLNYTKRCVDKTVSWLVGKGLTITVPDVFRRHTLPAILEVYDYNGLLSRDAKGELRTGQKLFDIGTTGAVTGDVFILPTWAPATAQAKRINPHTKGQIRVQVLNSEQCYPQWDPLNTDVLTSVRIETIYYDDRQQVIEDNYDQQARQLHVRRFSQIITPTQIIEQYQGQEPVVFPNPLGEIPLVHIKNHSLPGEYYGMADMDGILDLQREINEKKTDASDIINYHAAPIIAITGAKVKNLQRDPRNIWSGFPADARINVLNSGADLSGINNYIAATKKEFLELSEIPEGSLGQTQPISNTSGVALKTMYQPLVEKTERKRATYEPGLTMVNYYILRLLEITDPSFRLPTDLCTHCGGRIVESIKTDPDCPFCEGAGQLTRDGRPYLGSHIAGYGDPDQGSEIVRCSCVSATKKCYRINEQTFEFLAPKDMKVQYARQHSFGTRVEEAPFSQVQAEHDQHAPSFWDPEPQQSVEAKQEELSESAQPAMSDTGEPLPEPKPEPPQLPPSTKLPPEPETIFLRKILHDPPTGEQIVEGEMEIQVVPTGCEEPEYANPYDAKVTLNDSLPTDDQLTATLYKTWLDMQVVSRAWIRRNTPQLAHDADRIAKEVEEEAKLMPQPTGGIQAKKKPTPVGAGMGAAGNEQERMDGPPFGTNQPAE